MARVTIWKWTKEIITRENNKFDQSAEKRKNNGRDADSKDHKSQT